MVGRFPRGRHPPTCHDRIDAAYCCGAPNLGTPHASCVVGIPLVALATLQWSNVFLGVGGTDSSDEERLGEPSNIVVPFLVLHA